MDSRNESPPIALEYARPRHDARSRQRWQIGRFCVATVATTALLLADVGICRRISNVILYYDQRFLLKIQSPIRWACLVVGLVIVTLAWFATYRMRGRLGNDVTRFGILAAAYAGLVVWLFGYRLSCDSRRSRSRASR